MSDSKYLNAKLMHETSPNLTPVYKELAEEIGLNESLVLVQLAYLIKISKTEPKDGRRWTYQSLRDLKKNHFPYFSIHTIARAINKLIELELIIVGNYNKKSYDNTRWFTLNWEEVEKLNSLSVSYGMRQGVSKRDRVSQNETGVSQNETGVSQNETTIPEITTENTPEITTEEPPTPYPLQNTDNHFQENQEAGGGFSKEFLEQLKLIGVNKTAIKDFATSGWTEDEIKNEIEIIKNDKTVKSLAGLLAFRVRNESPSPVIKKASSDDPSKYISGEFAAYVNY